MNPSISLTLKKSFTEMEVELELADSFSLELFFENHRNLNFEKSLLARLKRIQNFDSLIGDQKIIIKTQNSFPHSSGIASSASSMSAVAFILQKLAQKKAQNFELQQVSEAARLLSGSAARSVYAGFVSWGDITNEHASKVNDIHPEFLNLKNTILITDAREKKVSSTLGHSLMDDHPYASARYSQAKDNFKRLLLALKNGHWAQFQEIVISEALALHAMMMTSRQPFLLINAQSVSLIEKLLDFVKNKKISFTLDAGPNIHLLFHPIEQQNVDQFLIENKPFFTKKIEDEILNDQSQIGVVS
jgi:diphosphomevalonate decarboxylase